MPTWTSDYQWSSGDGYVGWAPRVGGDAIREAYGLEPGLPSLPGLLLWPLGGRRYEPGTAGWQLLAPGTTRIANASLELGYRTKLFAHHCLDVGLRSRAALRDLRRDCKPPHPPIREDFFPVSLRDPQSAPAATEAFVKLELPSCDHAPAGVVPRKRPDRAAGRRAQRTRRHAAQGPARKARGRASRARRPATCSKYIPAQNPARDGAMARVKSVHLVLVDDDLPEVSASKRFFELNGTYIDGRQSYPLAVAATDAGAGIARIDVTHEGWPGPQPALEARASACDPHHHTAALGARICPETDGLELVVDTTTMPEGTRRFRAYATDPAGNVGERRWTVIIDRTAPSAPTGIAFTTPEEGSAQATWSAATDPALPDGTPGSGVVGYRFRHRIGNGEWSAWRNADDAARATDEVYDEPAGTHVDFEAVAVDQVGNTSDVARASGEVFGTAPEVSVDGPLADAAGGYIGASPLTVDVFADDGDGAGIRRLSLEREGAGELAAFDVGCTPRSLADGSPWKDLCPPAASHTFTVDPSALAEGHATFIAHASDRAHNAGDYRWDVIVDHTAPAPPSDLQLTFFNPDTGDATVNWLAGDDPALADGSPGAGAGDSEARYSFDGGQTFSDWVPGDDNALDFDGGSPNAQVVVEARSMDAAGNRSDPARGTFVLKQVIPPHGVAFGIWDGSQGADTASAARAARVVRRRGRHRARAAGITDPRFRGCVVDRNAQPTRGGAAGFTNIKFIVKATLDCLKGKDVFSQVSLKVCLQVQLGGKWLGYNFRGDNRCEKHTWYDPGTFSVDVDVEKLCYPGVHNVRMFYREDATLLDGTRLTDPSPGRHVGEDFDCNEAGAWRYIATKPSDPSGVLGRNLRRASDFPPGPAHATGNKGFAAHHIIASSQTTRHAPLAQTLGYACQIEPNGADNGVWLRNYPLQAEGEGKPPADKNTDDYNDLPKDGKARAYHPGIHTEGYFDFTAGYIGSIVGPNLACNTKDAKEQLSGLKRLLEKNQLPYGGPPGNPPPPGED